MQMIVWLCPKCLNAIDGGHRPACFECGTAMIPLGSAPILRASQDRRHGQSSAARVLPFRLVLNDDLVATS